MSKKEVKLTNKNGLAVLVTWKERRMDWIVCRIWTVEYEKCSINEVHFSVNNLMPSI